MPGRELPADVLDVTGRPDLLPPGDWFHLCGPDGAIELTMPRSDVLFYINVATFAYVREVAEDIPF